MNSDVDSVLFKSGPAPKQARSGRTDFSNMPVIRRFESLLTDAEFASAGLKVAPDADQKTYYIYSASDFVSDSDKQSLSNTVRPGRYFLYHSLHSLEPATQTGDRMDLAPVVRRLDELRSLASEEDASFNDRSARQALEWLRLVSPPNRPHVFLVNNGNTRLLWRQDGQQLGVQFLGNGTAQFVFLGQDDRTERIFGSIKVSELLKRLNGLDLCMILGFHEFEWPSGTVKTSFVTLAGRTLTAA